VSFPRHERSIVRWEVKPGRERSRLLRSRPLTVSMSRSWLFLGGLLSSRACLRFTSRFIFNSIGWKCKLQLRE